MSELYRITREEYMDLVRKKEEERRKRIGNLTDEEAENIIIDVFRDDPEFLSVYFEVKADMLEQQKKRDK
jgi:hypothetical protein